MRKRVNSIKGNMIHKVEKRNAWLFLSIILLYQIDSFVNKEEKYLSFKGLEDDVLVIDLNFVTSAAIRKKDHGKACGRRLS